MTMTVFCVQAPSVLRLQSDIAVVHAILPDKSIADRSNRPRLLMPSAF